MRNNTEKKAGCETAWGCDGKIKHWRVCAYHGHPQKGQHLQTHETFGVTGCCSDAVADFLHTKVGLPECSNGFIFTQVPEGI